MCRRASRLLAADLHAVGARRGEHDLGRAAPGKHAPNVLLVGLVERALCNRGHVGDVGLARLLNVLRNVEVVVKLVEKQRRVARRQLLEQAAGWNAGEGGRGEICLILKNARNDYMYYYYFLKKRNQTIRTAPLLGLDKLALVEIVLHGLLAADGARDQGRDPRRRLE
jgi:hypothetical protein